jgi:MoxR-like ATPase
LDRFLLKTIVEYPTREEELEIMKQYSSVDETQLDIVFTKDEVLNIRQQIDDVVINENIYEYIVDLVLLTRDKTFSDKYLAI